MNTVFVTEQQFNGNLDGGATTQVASCSGWTDNGSSVGAQTGNGRWVGAGSGGLVVQGSF